MNQKGTIIVLGGDGFCGWPTSLYLSKQGYRVIVVDNLVRRRIDEELGVSSLTPIVSMEDRVKAWKEVAQRERQNWDLEFVHMDVAEEYDRLVSLLVKERPHTVIHFAEQRSAPYSMKDSKRKIYTVRNNLSATTSILCAIVDVDPEIHLIHLGTMGVYGYGSIPGMLIPEGYMNVLVKQEDQTMKELRIVHPANPGSVYHTTKTQDHLLFQFYAKNDRLKITDLHQGIVWGTFTEETLMDDRLVNRFDWDSDYGTVLNRFIIQASINTPMTVYGSGGQTRAFIHIKDAMKCFELSVLNPPKRGDEVLVRNQVTETHNILDLANLVQSITNVPVQYVKNPRNEAECNTLRVDNRNFLNLNLVPTFLKEGLVEEILEIARKYSHRINNKVAIMPSSIWVNQKSAVQQSMDENHPTMKINLVVNDNVVTQDL